MAIIIIIIKIHGEKYTPAQKKKIYPKKSIEASQLHNNQNIIYYNTV
jgi:hypothetical protein